MNALAVLFFLVCAPFAHYDADSGWVSGEGQVTVTPAYYDDGSIEEIAWTSAKPVCGGRVYYEIDGEVSWAPIPSFILSYSGIAGAPIENGERVTPVDSVVWYTEGGAYSVGLPLVAR